MTISGRLAGPPSVAPGFAASATRAAPAFFRSGLARMGPAVVTRPSFVTDRGDQYLASVDSADCELLYPYASLRAAGVRLASRATVPLGSPTRGTRSDRQCIA